MRVPSSCVPILARRTALACIGTGLVLACQVTDPGRRPAIGDSVRSASQELVAAPELYTGGNFGAKELVLTFDDGPGPLGVTGELSTWLKNRPARIRATFFVNGACIAATGLPNNSCGTPVPGAAAVLGQVTNDGHLVANHTTTHRDITGIPSGERIQELAETDALISAYVPWNRFLFRAPFGAWNASVHGTVSVSAMDKYVGPIYWTVGGGPTDQSGSATKAADWECWQLGYTTRQCGDRYLTETRAVGRGIVLMHDPYGTTSNHDIDNGVGNTVDMVKYIVPILEGEGFTFRAIDDDPQIAAALPACNASCATCSGPGADQCTSCTSGSYASGGSCSACSACAAGSTYQTAACTATTNTVCAACATCADGTYASTACTPTTNTTCAACDPTCVTCSGSGASACIACSAGSFLTGGTCKTCGTCGAGTYPSTACTPTADTVCGACHTSCAACAGPALEQCGTCPPGYYLGGGICNACTVCAAGAYQVTACGASANTVCTPCAAGTFSPRAGAASCAACGSDAYASSPGQTSCDQCGACQDDNACTTDSCSPTAGCIHTPVAGCEASSGSAGTSGTPAESEAAPTPTETEARGCSMTGPLPNRSPFAITLGAVACVFVRRRRALPAA
jgi:peptidoglycan/xylan/chitin deacetylase (PgdA/CDA1 family)